jgi:hypothetical protein
MDKHCGGSSGSQNAKPREREKMSGNFEVFAWFEVAIHIKYMPRAEEKW